ncbi:hypothetical protein [Streptacidiphilus sp. EB103A]|uniref:hypothetical protein n=1 Tax=Streptacidiphilus sp. EB103A TaxID=3156275 RepID=UPI003519BE8F
MSNNTTRARDRAVRAYRDEHGVPLSEARRAVAALEETAAPKASAWEAFTPEERSKWEGTKLSGLASRQELRLLGEVAAELGSSMYALDVLRWGDEPVVLADLDSPDDYVLPRLPRQGDRQDQAWRARMARAFTDIAEDLRAGRAPVARCHAEDLVLMVAAQKAREVVEQAKEFAADPHVDEPGEEPLDAAGHLAEWFPGLGRVSLRRSDAFTYRDLEEVLLGAAEIYLLWDDDQGFECPGHPLGNQMMLGEDLRAERWFDTFATTLPRDPGRGFPEEVWSQLTEHARRALAVEPVWLGADDAPAQGTAAPGDPVCAVPDQNAPLGTVSAANFMVAAWRQQVLNLIGAAMGEKHRVWHVENPDQVWELDGRAVLSDVPEIALAQARRLMPGAAAGEGELVNVYWARPAPAGHYYPPLWFRVKAWEIEDHSTGPRDVPWMRVQWADGSLSGISFTDIVAIRRATEQDLSPWAPVTGELTPMPTLADYRRPEDDDFEEDEEAVEAERPAPDGAIPEQLAQPSGAAAVTGARDVPAHSIHPTATDGWRLVGHYLHHLAHRDPQHWRQSDAKAAQCRQQLYANGVERGQDVSVAMWLDLTDTEVACEDPHCQARSAYLTSDGAGRIPASGPLPQFARQDGRAYFEYQTHPHGDDGWASSVDPRNVEWMTTALALYGGVLRVNWMSFGSEAEGFSVGSGHTVWRVADHEATEVRRLAITSAQEGITTAESGDPAYETPPLPPEVQEQLERDAAAAPPARGDSPGQ